MKTSVIFLCILLFTVVCYGQADYTPIAVKYPGSIERGGDSDGIYFSKNSYESVKTFYINDKGMPKEETTGENNAKYAYFVYYTSPENPKMGVFTRGVHIDTNSGTERAIDYVFDKLQEGVLRKAIPQAEVDMLKDKYANLKYMYYLYDAVAKATEAMKTFRKYENIIKQNIEGQGKNLEDMSMQIQKLIAEGKMQEASELMKQTHSATGDMAEDMTSGAEYEEWKKCLAEIERNAYKTKIKIDDASNL